MSAAGADPRNLTAFKRPAGFPRIPAPEPAGIARKDMEKTIILGLGNLLYGDEGFGVRLAQHLYAHWDFPPGVSVVDGGTQGQTLLTFVEEADSLLVLDAVDFGLEPGELTPAGGSTRLCHSAESRPASEQLFRSAGLAALRGTQPRRCALLGVQPAAMTLGAHCSPEVERILPEAVNQALGLLRHWGIEAIRRPEPPPSFGPGPGRALNRFPATSGPGYPPIRARHEKTPDFYDKIPEFTPRGTERQSRHIPQAESLKKSGRPCIMHSTNHGMRIYGLQYI